MAQVIIVSNRLPVSVVKDKGKLVFSPSLGGLATGLASYVNNRSGNLWIGWPGIASDDLTDKDKEEITSELAKQAYVPVFLSQKQIDYFYNGFSNSVLWPAFHGLPMREVRTAQVKQWWKSYQSVNKLFSEIVISQANSKSQVWIHDYLLMLMPGLLRDELTEAKLGFFLHIPFPDNKNLKRVMHYDRLLKGLLGSDLIGFHTPGYVENFLDNVKKTALGSIAESSVSVNDRTVRVAEFPMGIDFQKFTDANKSKDVIDLVKDYKKKYGQLKLIVSIDRLDPSKGLVERLNAYRKFLQLYPKKRGKVILIMVAAPSRTSIAEYRALGKRLDKLAREINDEFSTSKWQPLEYINVPLLFENVTALFQIADVAFITPLRDGMNLAAKEFVASSKGGGVLILSQTAGAAEELKDALIVDPKNEAMLVDALNVGLSMKRRELKQRLKRMQRYLSTNTVQSWAKTFVDTLQQPLPGTPHITRTLNRRLRPRLLNEYNRSNKRLLLVDYDGTLVPLKDNYANLKPAKALLNVLNNLSKVKGNEIVLISGREQAEINEWFGKLPINLVSEHGAAIRKIGHEWQTIEKQDTAWKKIIIPIVKRYVRLAPGSSLEVKSHSLVWHYRMASPYHAQKYLVTLKRVLKPVAKRYGLQLMQGNKILEIKNPDVSKGGIARRLLNERYDFVLAIGDDVTDEELFSSLPISAHTIKVGRGLTRAQFRLSSYKDTRSLLKKMS